MSLFKLKVHDQSDPSFLSNNSVFSEKINFKIKEEPDLFLLNFLLPIQLAPIKAGNTEGRRARLQASVCLFLNKMRSKTE